MGTERYSNSTGEDLVCCYEALLVDICLLSPIRMW